MELLLSVVIALLVAAGVYCLMQPRPLRLVVGILILSHAVNLVVFAAGGLTTHQPALIAQGAQELAPQAADPLPQAFILTAIVIGFGVLGFTLALLPRVTRIDALPEELAP